MTRDETLIRAALEMAADEWPNVRVEGGLATAAVLAYADRIRSIDPAEVLAKVGADHAPDANARWWSGEATIGEIREVAAQHAVARLVEAATVLGPWISASLSDPHTHAGEDYTRDADAFLAALAAMEASHDRT